MKNNLLLLLCLLWNMQYLSAQPTQSFDYQWARQAGGPGNEGLVEISYDAVGNQYLLGSFKEGSLVFDAANALTSPNATDYFIAKYDVSGNLLWAKRLSTNAGADFKASSMHVDATGNITIAGSYSSQLSLGDEVLSTSEKDNIFYARYASSGDLVWARQMGGPNGDERVFGLDVDQTGNIYLTGQLEGEVHLDTPDIKEQPTAFVVKLHPSGEIIWKKENTFREDRDGLSAVGLEVKLDAAGNVILMGEFIEGIYWGEVELVSTEGQGQALFVVKLNQDGALLWANSIGTDHERSLSFYDMDVDGGGNIYVAGSFGLRLIYNHTELYHENVNFHHSSSGVAYVFKISPEGKGLWIIDTREASGDNEGAQYHAAVRSIFVDETGRIFGVGNIGGDSISFGGIVVQPDQGLHNRFITEVSPEGKWLWVKKLAGDAEGLESNHIQGLYSALSTDRQGNLIWAGEFTSSIELGENMLHSRGGIDVFLTSLDITPDEPSSMRITSFTLVNAATDKDIMTLNNGDVLYLNELPSHYTIRANVTGEAGSVALMLNAISRIENIAPYALAGDNNGDYHAMASFSVGVYNLSATPYSGMNKTGTAGEGLAIQLEVRERRETESISFTLVDAKHETDIMEIRHNTVLALDKLTDRLNIRANVNVAPLGSVVLKLTGYDQRIENVAPYALAGDRNGDYHDMYPTLAAGNYTLTAVVYSESNAKGRIVAERQLAFEARESSTSMYAESTEAFKVYPNPSLGQVNLAVAVEKSGYYALGIYDTKGRLVKQFFAGQLEAGYRLFTYDASGLPNGVYIAKLVNEREIQHQKILLSR